MAKGQAAERAGKGRGRTRGQAARPRAKRRDEGEPSLGRPKYKKAERGGPISRIGSGPKGGGKPSKSTHAEKAVEAKDQGQADREVQVRGGREKGRVAELDAGQASKTKGPQRVREDDMVRTGATEGE